MVYSRIDHKVEYKEMQGVHENDWNHASAVYKIEVEEKSVVVLLGRPNFEFDRIVYFRVYLLSAENTIEGQLGVFEISNYSDDEDDKKELMSQLFDADKDPNIHVFEEPLLYYFAAKLVEETKTSSESYLLAYNDKVDAEEKLLRDPNFIDDSESSASSSARDKKEGGDDDDEGDEGDEGGDEHDKKGAAKNIEKAAAASSAALVDTTVVFYLRGDAKKDDMPGESLPHERIKRAQMLDYRDLIRNMKKYNWRRMLHDSWDEHPIDLDGKKWKSVLHYVCGCKFKHENPAFYKKFALNSESNISKQSVLALSAASKSGVHEYLNAKQENIALREQDVVFDKDYDRGEVRARALFAKFSQHHVLKEILLATRTAKLCTQQYGVEEEDDDHHDRREKEDNTEHSRAVRRNRLCVEDKELMSLRSKIADNR